MPKILFSNTARHQSRWGYAISAGLVATIALAGLTPAAEAAPIASDSFAATSDGSGETYATGTLYGQDPTTGVTGFEDAWGNADDSSSSDLVIQADGLSHGLVTGTTHDGAISSAGGTSVRAMFRELSDLPDSDTYYASFVMATSGSRRASLGLREEAVRDTQVTDSLGGVSVGFWGSSGIQAWVNGEATTVLSDFTVDETYFVMVEILDNGDGSDDTVNVNLYASSNTDLNSPDASVSITNQDVTGTLSHLAVMKDWGATVDEHASFDEFRFGTTLDSVAVPEPGSLGLLSLGALAMFGRRRGA